MAINYHPSPGAILICDYSTGFREPEMVKRRLCVVITPRLRRRTGLCTVVPLSMTPPDPAEDYHCLVDIFAQLPKAWAGQQKWAKCDMLATVGHHRLSAIGTGQKDADGRRRYIFPHITGDQFRSIRKGVLCALTLRDLTQHL